MERKAAILFLFLFSGLYSCKKDSPAGYPTLTLNSPYNLEYFNVPGTIHVTGHASDFRSLTSITISLTNSQSIPVEQTVSLTITSNNMDFSCNYSLSDVHLSSGQYYITIKAFNGTNTTSAFQKIYIDALPTRRTAIYAITRNSAGVHAWGIDSSFKVSPSLSYTVPGDYSSSDIDCYYQQLYTAGKDSGNVNVYSVPDVTPYWSLPATIGSSPFFTNVYCNVDNEFVSYYLGYIKCYNHRGVLQSVYNSLFGYYPIKTFLWSGWLFAEQKDISSSQEYLLSYYASTTASYQQALLAGPMVAMYGYDNNDLFVFGNTASSGAYMQLYNINTNLFFSPVSLSAYGQLLSVAQVNENTYLLSFNNGTIYQYTYNPNSIVPYIGGTIASNVRYDSINNQVVTSAGNTVNAYNYGISNATLVNSVILADSIRDIRVLYNK